MNINALIGKTLVEVAGKEGDDEIIFKTTDGKTFRMYHRQDCCESVRVEDICGDLQDLIGSPICQAEESSSRDYPQGYKRKDGYDYIPESMTWTFYRLATQKGQVVIRWYGESNGYYSEEVSFDQI